MADNKEQKIKFSSSDDLLKGNYSNFMQIRHNKFEFVMDFFLAVPPRGELVSRVITNPAHAKKVAQALQENIRIYEEKFGKIENIKQVRPKNMGFTQK